MKAVSVSPLSPLTLAIYGALIFSLGFAAQSALSYLRDPAPLQTESNMRITGKYPLVSPLLLCGGSAQGNFGKFALLDSKLNAVVDTAIASGEAANVSVYFRNPNGQWLSINADEPYAPASLLKVPLMIAYFKQAESNPDILKRRVYFDGSFNDNKKETFESVQVVKPGWYTIDELVRAMIVQSDNNATRLLNMNIGRDILSEVYTDLGLSVPPSGAATVSLITPKQYSYFFRVLYNTTYLSPELSQKAIEYLSMGGFKDGIRAGVREGVPVAEKFGERTILDASGTVLKRELHDCGIIYDGEKRYFLCIMTRGMDFPMLTQIIQNITKTVYNEMHTSAL